MGKEFDFWKGQVPTKSPSKPEKGVVGLNIDRCISMNVPGIRAQCVRLGALLEAKYNLLCFEMLTKAG